MSGTDEPDRLSDHEYFQTIEEVFVELRGSPLLLSPKDWQTAREWHREGIPLDLVLRTLEEIFERRRERGEEDKVTTLRYCNRAVRAAWKRVQEMTGAAAGPAGAGDGEAGESEDAGAVGGRTAGAGALDLDARLAALAGALPQDLPGRKDLAARIVALSQDRPGDRPQEEPPEERSPGRTEERPGTRPEARPGKAAGASGERARRVDERHVEEALAELDREVLGGLVDGLDGERRRALEAEVERSVAALADRLPRDEITRARRRLLDQKVRRLYGLPTLSLFAPEAQR